MTQIGEPTTSRILDGIGFITAICPQNRCEIGSMDRHSNFSSGMDKNTRITSTSWFTSRTSAVASLRASVVVTESLTAPCFRNSDTVPFATRMSDLSTVRLDSVLSGPKDKIEACSLGKCLEVPIPREKRNISVDTALGDQRVAETRLPPPR